MQTLLDKVLMVEELLNEKQLNALRDILYVYKEFQQITWQYTKNNTLKKENYDQTDAYCAALGLMKMDEIW